MHMHGFFSRLTAYFPPPQEGYSTDGEAMLEGGSLDRLGKPLHTLQSFLSGHAPYVSVAADTKAFPYGTRLCCPHMDDHYGKHVELWVVDTGGAFTGQGRERLDICVSNKTASYDPLVNNTHAVVALLA